jgi:hypothetical protein
MSPFAYQVWVDGEDEPRYVAPETVRQMFINVYYFEVNKKGAWEKLPFISRWIADENIKTYTRIVFDPDCTRSDVYNLWRPYVAESIPPVPDGSVDELIKPIVKHIDDVIALHRPEHTQWILDWWANIIQRPKKKTQVSILLYGEEGCGKGILFEYFREKIVGKHLSFQTANPENALLSRFANGFHNRLIIQVDEVKRLHDSSERLKDFITNSTIDYEKKNVDRITVDNLTNLVFTTNNPHSVKVSMKDRRYSFFHCSSLRLGDAAYFQSLGDHLARPEVARAFFQHLKARDLSQYRNCFQASRPITEYYREMQLMGIPVTHRFLSGLINDGRSGPWRARELYKAYQDFHKSGGYSRDAASETLFGREVSIIPGVHKIKTNGIVHYRMDAKAAKAHLQGIGGYDQDATCVD